MAGSPAGRRLAWSWRAMRRALGEQHGVVDGHSRPHGQVDPQGEGSVGEGPAPVGGEHERPQHPPPGLQGEDGGRAQADGPYPLPPLRVGGRAVEELVVDLPDELDLAGADDGAHARRRLGVGRVAVEEAPDELHPRRVGVGQAQEPDRPVAAGSEDGAAVGQAGDGQLDHPGQGALVVERRGQRRRRLGQEGHAPVGLLRRLPGRLLGRDRGPGGLEQVPVGVGVVIERPGLAHDARRLAARVEHGPVPDQGPHHGAVLVPDRERPRPRLARAQAGHDRPGLARRVVGHEDLDHVPADGLPRRPAVEALGGRVPQPDGAFGVGGDQRLGGRFDDRPPPAVGIDLLVAHPALGRAALGQPRTGRHPTIGVRSQRSIARPPSETPILRTPAYTLKPSPILRLSRSTRTRRRPRRHRRRRTRRRRSRSRPSPTAWTRWCPTWWWRTRPSSR